jgi:hypothetical protein
MVCVLVVLGNVLCEIVLFTLKISYIMIFTVKYWKMTN